MKVIYLVSALALTCMFSCNKVKEEKSTAATPVTTKAVVDQEKETTIKIGPDGGSLKTKNVELEIEN
jgi:hypothetical protein